MKQIPMPERIAALPVHPNGFPIPFFVHRETGKPVDLRIASPSKQIECIAGCKCWVCGQRLGKFTCFIDGPQSMGNGVFFDGAMHRDCAEYALQVCPYLATTSFDRREDGLERTHAPYQDMKKPERFGLLISKGYSILKMKDGSLLWRASQPYEVIWWKDGQRFSV